MTMNSNLEFGPVCDATFGYNEVFALQYTLFKEIFMLFCQNDCPFKKFGRQRPKTKKVFGQIAWLLVDPYILYD